MIKFENVEVTGWEAAIRGMRNPMNSWEKSDTDWFMVTDPEDLSNGYLEEDEEHGLFKLLGENDLDLMLRLRRAGTDHRKFMRMITVYVDITAPLYWWKEFDTYKVGTVANSCSTMHKIHAKEFTLEDFSLDHFDKFYIEDFKKIVDLLNNFRDEFNNPEINKRHKRKVWYSMIQLLPSSYNQKRTVMLNYEVLANIYKSRKNHKLDEWSVGFIQWIEGLPYSELITG